MLGADLLQWEGLMQSSLKEIDNVAAARLLMEDSPKRRLLLSMVRRTRTVSEIAVAEEMPIGRAYQVVKQLERHGLARVEREEKRGGRAIRHYRAVAGSFLVPLEYVSGSPGAGLAAETRARLDDELSRTEERGILFYVDADGDPLVSWFGNRQRRRPVAEFWQILRLRDADALELIGEMEALLRRYQERAQEGRVFLIHGAIVPRRPR